ncbi:MAG: hypothetical protein II951_05625 [Bacteroidales bacterium]|nr:hypothetical protein [Bacteroidales bacterium]
MAICLFSCRHHADREKSEIAAIIPTKTGLVVESATKARIVDDSLLVVVNGILCKMDENGEIWLPNRLKSVKILDEGIVQDLYYVQRGGDIFFFANHDHKDGKLHCRIVRVYIATFNIVWKAELDVPILCSPEIRGQFAYLAGVGSVGKLTLKNGVYEWRYNRLETKGRYEYFESIVFPGNYMVNFVSKRKRSVEKDTLVINDISGEIIRMR